MATNVQVQGACDSRFERVRQSFEGSFASGEVGAALAVTLDGEPVVDLWGGYADAARTRPWQRDTIVNVYSTTKGMTAICAHRLVEQGRLDLDAAVARYWPEFAQAGKDQVPVRHLLSHQAGLAPVAPPITVEHLYDWHFMTSTLAAQAPAWKPGTQHGYHALTFGYLVGELVRRVDGRSLGRYFREEIAKPLEVDFHIGLDEHDDARCADMIPAPPPPQGAADVFVNAAKNPESLAGRVFGNPRLDPRQVNTRGWRGAEIPAANGHGDARGLARIYGALACNGDLDGVHILGPDAINRATTEQAFGTDAVLAPLHTRFGLGFFLTQPMIPFGPNPRAFGHPGAGGSIAFADPDARLGFAYVMNQMQQGLSGDARGFSLIFDVYNALN
ncbi:MAG TPA: serine hydrolase domain-containing protein [Candidatus Binatia bacterium]|nr:serine hydrolase domain-containing protein [Candidatus Binatia bacterium]